ncbi:hypothetical protein ACFU9X_42790 [Streptomyces atratus]|uniref:hypothetical protein n=1 Tax=Streptomyces atratus TaxID=1893 RepID=UPI0036BD256C
MPGWEGEKQLHSEYGKADSPGYTEEQAAKVVDFQAQLLKLSITVSTRPFWDSVDVGDRVEARMALKHAHEPAEA